MGDPKPTGKRKAIRVMSFDKGCLYNGNFIENYEDYDMVMGVNASNPDPAYEPVVQANKAFLKQHVIEQNHKYSRNIMMNGSELQSNEYMVRTIKNMHVSGKLSESLDAMSQHTETEKDGFMLADVYGDKYPGYSDLAASKPALDSEEFNYVHPKSHRDETLLTVIYAQMHKLANDNPNEPIVFEYFSADPIVLQELHNYFTDNANLIPKNINLQLINYNISKPKPIKGAGILVEEKLKTKYNKLAPIVGTGIIDKNYYATVKEIYKQLRTLFKHNSVVDQNKKGTKMGLSDMGISIVTLAKTRRALTQKDPLKKNMKFNLDNELKAVVNKGARYARRKNVAAQKAAMDLHDKLHRSLQAFTTAENVTSDKLDKFVEYVDDQIKKADKQISNSSMKKKLGMFKSEKGHTEVFGKLQKEIKKQVETMKEELAVPAGAPRFKSPGFTSDE